MVLDKKGRERRYDLSPLDGFQNREVGFAAAALDELRERVYDQVADLPKEALNFYQGETKLSIGRLLLHLGWAEAHWLRRLSGKELPGDLDTALAAGELELFDKEPAQVGVVGGLIQHCRRVRDEVTVPFLKEVRDIDETRMDDGTTVRGVGTAATARPPGI